MLDHPLDLDDQFALLSGLLTKALILDHFAIKQASLAPFIDAGADQLRQLQPGKPEGQRRGKQQDRDPDHARTGKAEELHAQRAQRKAHCAAGMSGQMGFPGVKPCPFKRASGAEQQQGAQQARKQGPDLLRRTVDMQDPGQAAQPPAQGQQRQAPGRVAETEQQQIRNPGPECADFVGILLTAACD